MNACIFLSVLLSAAEGGGEGSSSEEEDEDSEGGGGGGGGGDDIADETGTDVVNLRRIIYLTIMSSLDFEEAGHKLMKIQLRPGQVGWHEGCNQEMQGLSPGESTRLCVWGESVGVPMLLSVCRHGYDGCALSDCVFGAPAGSVLSSAHACVLCLCDV
jgi:hypothetical protein